VGGALYNNDGTTLIQYPCGLAGAFTVPSGVTTIAAHAFSESPVLTRVTFSDTVTSINNNCAFGATSITDYIVDASNSVYSSLNGVIYNKISQPFCFAPKGICRRVLSFLTLLPSLLDGSFGGCEFFNQR